MSYFKDKFEFVEKLKGFWTVNIFCLVVNKFVICNCPFVEKLFKLLNIVVDVAFKLFIDNWALWENEFRLLNVVPTVEFILNTDKPEVIIFPTTFNELLKVVFPEMLNVLKNDQ